MSEEESPASGMTEEEAYAFLAEEPPAPVPEHRRGVYRSALSDPYDIGWVLVEDEASPAVEDLVQDCERRRDNS